MGMHHPRVKLRSGILLMALLLGACASGPAFDTGGVDRSLTPRSVATGPQQAAGRHVLWGGLILGTTNLQDRTRLEVLAYPLDASARPLDESEPQGRFMLEQAGYLDPASYAEGRRISVVGTVTGTLTGQVDESDYIYPLIEARQLHLWSRGSDGVRVGGYIGFGTGGGGDLDSGSEIGFGF
jgi:outer membrane lipoprotein